MSENTELATTENTNAPLAISTFAADAKKATIFNALNDAYSLADEAPDTIVLQGIIMKDGIRRARTQNDVDTPCVDTYLVADDGTAYFTQSDGIARSARDMLALYGNDVAGLVVRVVEKQLANGNTVKNLRIMD